jgi:hypothetical protein
MKDDPTMLMKAQGRGQNVTVKICPISLLSLLPPVRRPDARTIVFPVHI